MDPLDMIAEFEKLFTKVKTFEVDHETQVRLSSKDGELLRQNIDLSLRWLVTRIY
jgi:hypothetical protein